MSIYTDDARVLTALQELRASLGGATPRWSDIVDDAGNQYVDIVMEGGGVLGIALVGYTYALEQMGIRFLSAGGTSAGAINALLLAAVDDVGTAKSERLLDILGTLDMFAFVDGDGDARDMVRALIDWDHTGVVKLAWKAAQVIDNLREDLGLNPGRAFYDWLADTLLKKARTPIASQADLTRLLARLPATLHTRDGTSLAGAHDLVQVAIVAADVSTETKVVFPSMATLYWADPTTVNPAHYVRASMSIPGFFWPVRIPNMPTGPAAAQNWDDLAGYHGELPSEAVLVDGGIMSNFPIDVFHVDGVPRAPTFGVKIGGDRRRPRTIGTPFALAGAVFDSARHYADYDFLLKHPDYSNLVGTVDTGTSYWLNFFMETAEKVSLFAAGVEAAARFLATFDWPSYKAIRARLAEAQALRSNAPHAKARAT